jgi:electron transfer flavoprotein beta subunit
LDVLFQSQRLNRYKFEKEERVNNYVFVKRVPDTESKIRIDHETNTIIEEGLNFVLSPYDEYAVEESLRLREANGGKVTAVTVGSEEALTTLKKCLAMGADEAVLLKDEVPETHDGLRTAKILARAIEKKFSDHILSSFLENSLLVRTMLRFLPWWQSCWGFLRQT